jgi:hypothetical protein
MPITYKKNQAFFADVVSVEEAEGLLEWLLKKPSGKVDLSGCSHLHPANLQVLMAAGCPISALPRESGLAAWVATALKIKI